MHHANLPMEMWYWVFGEIFTTVMLLDGLTVIELSGKHANRYKHFFGETPKLAYSLHTVGEVVQQKSNEILLLSWKIMVSIV